ncbi:helix-turn-helix type 11 domain-containing protein [Streptomyces davaonensis JCM 4913]|uniref:Helix-turn-helix type 11 domain-containing protein n=1 Tax=Streptomyces davaonensis (strain DSM 101723 / JCM 4913 / KCC S-0913 / 768) TaxID=1214101 RepID=K4RF13_STRDJ|nr:YafY family protein [Streptomyces davaonensis]CCK32393.1 helix-turn-helix type 11 domain-containing protein [Streptomyces davaonensis JCM 4913]
MSAGRLLSVLLMLQSRGRLSAQTIAEELGVSVRTAYRDLTRLQAAGVPVYAEPGRRGGYQLLDGYRTRLTGMSEREARALFFAGLPGPAADLGLAGEVTAARLKLLAALPTGLREEAEGTAAVFHLDAPGWYREPEPAPHLPLLVEAVLTRRAVDVRYRRWRAPQEVSRRVRPYGLVLKSGTWYLVAASEKGVATYRAAQVLDAALSDELFDRPGDFDLGAYWTSYLDDFRSRRYTGTATVRLSPRGRERLPDNVAPDVVRAVDATATPVGDDGWCEAVIPTESTRHACGELLRLGVDVEVVAPAELRRAMADTVQVLARAYGLMSSDESSSDNGIDQSTAPGR